VALKYAEFGLQVFPVFTAATGLCQCGDSDCKSPGKHPKTQHGHKAASSERSKIVEWFEALWPESNIGIATGAASGVIVLDVDPQHDGDKSLTALVEQYGPLPRTPTARTGGGGQHVLFRHPGKRVGNRVGFLPGLDIRGDGGYIVAPPSSHVSGGCYEWQVAPWDAQVAEAPSWLWVLLSRTGSKKAGRAGTRGRLDAERIPDGERNCTLASLAGTMRRRGMTEEEICAALMEVNSGRCDPPLLDAEVERVASSVGGYTPAPQASTLTRIDPRCAHEK